MNFPAGDDEHGSCIRLLSLTKCCQCILQRTSCYIHYQGPAFDTQIHIRIKVSRKQRLMGIKMETFKLYLIFKWSPEDFEVYQEGLQVYQEGLHEIREQEGFT